MQKLHNWIPGAEPHRNDGAGFHAARPLFSFPACGGRPGWGPTRSDAPSKQEPCARGAGAAAHFFPRFGKAGVGANPERRNVDAGIFSHASGVDAPSFQRGPSPSPTSGEGATARDGSGRAGALAR